MYLKDISNSKDIKKLTYKELEVLAKEIRKKIIKTVSKNGGHLSSNLGVVEITLALHRVFNPPEDKIIFDVGHQCYTHKLITGRYEEFNTLRQFNGLSGFPKRSESEYDCFETGHASTSVSGALGFARARSILGTDEMIVAIIGDGALTGGMSYEALNDAGSSNIPMIIILNDNEMSISKNVGALAEYLTKIRSSAGWDKAKNKIKIGLKKVPLIGEVLYKIAHRTKKSMRDIVVDEGFFSALGFHYLGPINGHDIKTIENVLANAKKLTKPVIVHCITKKGFGYNVAEDYPDYFHGAVPFSTEKIEQIFKNSEASCGEIVSSKLVKMARENAEIIVITAAMRLGTGMDSFGRAFPLRSIDVGIAESHGVTMAAAMALAGLKPYVAIYSTFLQRAYDQLFHDIALQNSDVCFLIDRAGIAGQDGETHNGVFDFAYIRSLPNFRVFAPKDMCELGQILLYSENESGPIAIRYPKKLSDKIGITNYEFEPGRWNIERHGDDGTILAIGSMVEIALKVAKILYKEGIKISVINASSLKPLDERFLKNISSKYIFTAEEHVIEGGFFSAISEFLIENNIFIPIYAFAIRKTIPHGDRKSLMKMAELDEEYMALKIKRILKQRQENENQV